MYKFTVFVFVYGIGFARNVRILRTYSDFVRVERLLHTYMAYLLRALCEFCVRIRIIFTMLNTGNIEGF